MNISEIGNKVWLINDLILNIFFIQGTKSALLIDTGFGFGELKNTVSSLTSLPIIVVNTHGHIDHTSGNFQFNEAYIHDDDLSIAKETFTTKCRTDFVERYGAKAILPKNFSIDKWINTKFDDFIPLKNKTYFDLGDRIVDIIHTPGHTAGSICFLDNKTGFLISGDSVTEGNLLLNLDESLPLNIFLNSLNKLIAIEDKIKYILPYHSLKGKFLLEPSIIHEHREAIEKILSGNSKGIAKNSIVGNGLFLRYNNFTIAYKENFM